MANPSWCLEVMMMYFIPASGHAHPFVGVEPDGVEAVDVLLVLRDGDVPPAHDPLADARDALSLVRAGWHCVGPPVDEHPEPRLAPPRHARVALGGGFGRGGLHHRGEQNQMANGHGSSGGLWSSPLSSPLPSGEGKRSTSVVPPLPKGEGDRG